MASRNLILLMGHLGGDPEVRTFPSGDKITTFSLATTERWKDRETGEQKEATQWHDCVAGNQLGEIVATYGKKGMLVDVSGKLVYRKFTDTKGVEKRVSEIRIDTFQMLERRERSDNTQRSAQAPQQSRGQQRSNQQPARQASAPQRNAAPAPSENWDDGSDDIPY